MNRREIIKSVFRGERGLRIPRALFGGGLWAMRQSGLNPAELLDDPTRFGKLLAQTYGGLDTDIVFAGSGLNTFPAETIGGALAFRGEQAPLLSFPLIEKSGDARALEEIDIRSSPHSLALIEAIKVIRECLPDRYLCVTSWGPFTWAMILCEWEFLRSQTVHDRLFVREVCELGVRLSLALIEPLLVAGVIDGVSVPDGAVTLIPNDLYTEIILPCEKKLFDGVRALGGTCVLHQCGNIASQIEFYPGTGADCISVDAGVAIGEVYELYRGRAVTAGNVDVVNTIFGGGEDAISDAVAACVGQIPDPFSGFILMPSCDLPPETPIGNVREFLSCANRSI